MAIGGIVVMWPQAERQRIAGYSTRLRPQHAEAAEAADVAGVA